jgi:hypothetical protein
MVSGLLSDARSDLQKAEQLVLEAKSALSIANAELSRAMGLQENRVFIVSEEPLKQLPAKSAAPLVARALQNRPDLIALRDQVEGAGKFALAERDARLPKLQAFGSFGTTPVGDPGVQGNYVAAGINAKWARLDSSVNLDGMGNPDPYYVSIDLPTARHPQTLLATQQNSQSLTVQHGALLRLLAPMKIGLKNIKAITQITYSAEEPTDYWADRGYSRYEGI